MSTGVEICFTILGDCGRHLEDVRPRIIAGPGACSALGRNRLCAVSTGTSFRRCSGVAQATRERRSGAQAPRRAPLLGRFLPMLPLAKSKRDPSHHSNPLLFLTWPMALGKAQLKEFDPSVKEAAAWALGYIARHTKELAQTVVDAGAVPLLVLCFQEPELTLKRIAASALSDICKHSPELAQTVVDAGAVSLLAKDISHNDAPLKRQVHSVLVWGSGLDGRPLGTCRGGGFRGDAREADR